MSTIPPPAPRPRILDALGEELVRAARAHEQAQESTDTTNKGGARRGPAGRWAAGRGNSRSRPGRTAWRPILIAIAVLLLLAAVALAATLVIGRGDPIPPPPAGAVPRELQPVAGTDRLNHLDVADPDGGPPWDVRTSRSHTGATCVTVGQIMDGTLGIVGLDRRFRALPAGVADTCSAPQRTGATIAAARALRGGGTRLHAITVLDGVVARGVQHAVAFAGDQRIELRLGPGGAFLAVVPGVPEQLRPRLELTEAGGATTTLRFADTGEFLAPDSSGGTPWTIRGAGPGLGDGHPCVYALREPGPDSPPPLPAGTGLYAGERPILPVRCAAGTPMLDVERFNPRFEPAMGRSVWNFHPSRTIAWGIAPSASSVVTVAVAGRPARRVAVEPRSHGFLAALDGKTDPAAVRVTIDGRAVLRSTNLLDLHGRPLPATPIEPWRSVAAAVAATRLPVQIRPVTRTIALGRTAADPTGGPSWAVRSWIARETGRESGHQHGVDVTLRCFQVGVPGPGGTLREPLAGGRWRTLGTTFSEGTCVDARALARAEPTPPVVRTQVDDPTLAAPRPTRVVVSGRLGSGARSARLLGLRGGGAGRPLALGRDGTFLMVLGPDAAGRALRVRFTRSDGRVATTPSSRPAPGCTLQGAATARIADPEGGPPWAFGAAGSGAGRCRFFSQVVAGRLVTIDPVAGTVRYQPTMYSTGPAQTTGSARMSVDVEHGPAPTVVALGEDVSAAQIARRTLPGRTLVTGEVSPDVVSITLRTPRDVRTIVPAGGTFLAVYDGAFYGGRLVATARLRDGRTITARRVVR